MDLKKLSNVAEIAAKIMGEGLKGDQHKIDVNKNNKIDSEDFKHLRAGKKPGDVKKEEVEQVEEAKYEPAAPNPELIAKRKAREAAQARIEAQRQAKEDEFGGGEDKKEVKPTTRKVAGRAYGGANQKDETNESVVSFTSMLEQYKESGLKSISQWSANKKKMEEQASEEEFNDELKDQQEKSEGKKKQPNLAKGDVQAVKVEEEAEETVEVELVVDGENGYAEAQIEERAMTDAETKKKEEIVKSMKKGMAGFKERYGDRAKEVMYATATKQAMKD